MQTGLRYHEVRKSGPESWCGPTATRPGTGQVGPFTFEPRNTLNWAPFVLRPSDRRRQSEPENAEPAGRQLSHSLQAGALTSEPFLRSNRLGPMVSCATLRNHRNSQGRYPAHGAGYRQQPTPRRYLPESSFLASASLKPGGCRKLAAGPPFGGGWFVSPTIAWLHPEAAIAPTKAAAVQTRRMSISWPHLGICPKTGPAHGYRGCCNTSPDPTLRPTR